MHTIHRIIAISIGVALLMASAVGAQSEPALWVVKGPHATVYLFGTVHVLRKDKEWRSPKIDAAIHASKDLWLEVSNADDQAAAEPLAKQFGLDAAHPLSTKLTKEQLAHLDAAAKEAGIPTGEAALEPLRPWLAAVSLSMVPILKAGYDPKSGVEMILKPEFVKDGKPVHGLETIEQQLHFFADLPQKTEVDYLDSTLKDFDGGAQKFDHIVDAWYAGNVEGKEGIDGLVDGEFRDKYPDLYKSLVVGRNKVWTGQIETLLKGDGVAFVAVGAGHLAGPDSVQVQLKAAGYTVERQ